MYEQLAGRERSIIRRFAVHREAKKLAQMERELMVDADEIWTLTSSDAAAYNELFPGTPVRIIEITPPSPPSPTSPIPPDFDIGLLGTWTWAANEAGLRWFLSHVVPKLSSTRVIRVAGRVPNHVLAPQNVTFMGRVDEAFDFLARCRVVCVPSVAGGGLQIKMLDAIASGKPVVASSLAGRGLNDLPRSVCLCDDAAEMAAELEFAAAYSDVDRREMHHASEMWLSARRERLARVLRASVDDLVGLSHGAIA
jgi:glycosyltransferase involved in cell wall biosynthesis